MSVIDTIYNSGDDALGYEFQVSIGPIPYLDVETNWFVRTTTFDIPEQSIGEVSYKFRGETVVKHNGEITTPKTFDIELRVDKYYNVYKFFRLWMAGIINPDTGLAASDTSALPNTPIIGVSAFRIPITVSTGFTDVDGRFKPTLQIWSFTGCYPKSISALTLDNQSGDPLLVRVSFNYIKLL